MQRSRIYFLFALSLTIVVACSQKEKSGIEQKETSESFEKGKISAGLNRLGINDGYEIFVSDECDLVENTASEMLQKLLVKGGLNVRIVPELKYTGKRRFLLGRDSNLKTIRDLSDKGDINIRNVFEEDDRFHLKQTGKDIVIAGANPRGVLFGVYAFEDFIKDDRKVKMNIRRIPQFAARIVIFPVALIDDHPSSHREFSEKTAECFVQLGVNVNGCLNDGYGLWSLSRFVSSDAFPFQKPPDSEFKNRILKVSSLCKEYGIDYYIMLWEPDLAKVGAEINNYPPEALGKVMSPWGGDKDSMDITLCVSSPIVQEHYSNMIKKIVGSTWISKDFYFIT